jgi:PTS system nitrogen regulatory IIA component
MGYENPLMPHRTLNLEEAAQFLHLEVADLQKLVLRDEIPHEKRGSAPVFRVQEVEAWASERLLGLKDAQLKDLHKTASGKAHNLVQTHAIVPELIQPSFIRPALQAKTKASVLRGMVELADSTGLCLMPNDILVSLEAREEMCSTALAGGLALLHPRHHEPYTLEDSFVVLGRTPQPVPFGAPDGERTDLFFLVCCQEDRIHLHVLARLCMLCSQTDLLSGVRTAESADEMYDELVKAEEEVIKKL